MKGKKWLFMVLCALLCALLVWTGMNFIVDPFNAFGDRVMKWDSYTQTLNPRNSKITYISERFDEFDSYVVGSSSAASFLPQTLDKYFDASFYNMFHYGSDIQYDKELTQYLLKNDDVKNIVLVVGLNEAVVDGVQDMKIVDYKNYRMTGESKWSYYPKFLFADPDYAFEKIKSYFEDTELPQPFDVFVPGEGTYDKRKREVESIGELSAYMELHSEDFYAEPGSNSLKIIDKLVENVGEIRRMCEEAGAELTVVVPPVYESHLNIYTEETLNELYTKLAGVTDYWNFAVSSVSGDGRYFYDMTHTRNELINMALARMFEDNEVYYPENFGIYCKLGDNVSVEMMKSTQGKESYTKVVPIMLYHDFNLTPEDSPTSQATFKRHMELLWTNGFEPVSFEQLIDFVEKGTPLPEKPVAITFDDGYSSNYELAFPVLQEYGFKGTIFVIGCSVGHEKYYKDTEFELTPHFGQKEISEMEGSGLVSVESHTYDMHQWPPFESGDKIRDSILPFEDESEADYIKALTNDIEKQNALFESVGLPPSQVIAFPGGRYDDLVNVVLKANGYKVTIATDNSRVNTVVAGLPQSLLNLGRISADDGLSDEALLSYLNNGKVIAQ